MNSEQNEKKQEQAGEHGELPEELIEEIDFDRFAESKKSDETQVSSDYRSAYQKKPDRRKKSSKRSPEEKKVRAALEAADQARIKAQKMAADLAQAAQAPDPEPEPELDDFLPEGETAGREDILLIKKDSRSPEEQEQEQQEIVESPEAAAAPAAADRVPSLRRRGKYRYGIGMGALIMVLAFVGLSVIVWGVGQQIYRAVTDDSQLRAYDTFLSPVVMQDPEPFESPKEADAEMIMKASLWRAVTQNGAQYNSYDDQGRTLVPLGDVVDACHALFGPDCDLQPSNPQEETFFEYDSEQNVFRVTPYSSQSSFSPYTVSSKKSGDTVILRVGYVVGDWQDGTESESATPEPVKYMQYVLKKTADGKSEYVTAVRADNAS